MLHPMEQPRLSLWGSARPWRLTVWRVLWTAALAYTSQIGGDRPFLKICTMEFEGGGHYEQSQLS